MKSLVLIVVPALAAGIPIAAANDREPIPGPVHAEVSRVYDGDTLMVRAQVAGEEAQGLEELAVRPMNARASEWRCEMEAQFGCTVRGCDIQTSTGWIDLDFARRTYERCDSKGCDAYPMTYFRSGLYTNINIGRSGGAMFKAINDGSEFVEVVSLGIWTLNGFGECRPR